MKKHGFKSPLDRSVLFLIVILAVLAITCVFLVQSLKRDIVSDAIENDALIKILFVFEDQGKALFTDVFFYYPPLKRGAVFSIPGNTGAIYQSLGQVDRIDSVYNSLGIEAYRREVETLLDQTIPFSVTITLDNLCVLADLFGGLRAFVPNPVDSEGPNGERWLLPSGAVTLDGGKLRTYITYSLPEETGEEKQEREQSVMVSLLSAFNEHSSFFTNRRTLRVISPLFSSNVDREDLADVLAEISQVSTDRMVPQTVIGNVRLTSDGKSLLFPHSDGQLIKDVLKQTTGALVSLEETNFSRIYVLEIQNGTTVQGLARNTGILLQSIGYEIFAAVNAPSSDVARTVIINHIGDQSAAKQLGDFIHCTNIVVPVIPEAEEETRASQVDFTLILGKDFDGRYVR
ncbi:MAG: LytR C-terminal domain-containing protein [Spirochaetaceae bacterium]|jgi:anionic cell wall polymer biosynthesis LytR-Cps2A-Psr (LCP) family protein|nr:LytR C-terminal domain-containing protein [Spirochaetaceae bacterium]